MFAFGVVGLLTGTYLIDCAIKGRPPIETLKAIIANPGNTERVLADIDGTSESTMHKS